MSSISLPYGPAVTECGPHRARTHGNACVRVPIPIGALEDRFRRFHRALERVGRTEGQLLVFAIGSLLWRRPAGLVPVGTARATGMVKSFCVSDPHHRGTPARPGLTLGLVPDPGAPATRRAHGQLLSLHRDAAADLVELFARESVVGYEPAAIDVKELGTRTPHVALGFVATSVRAGPLQTVAERARVIGSARGTAGTNLDYLHALRRAEAALGIGPTPEAHVLHACLS